MEKGSDKWLAHANETLKKKFPKAKGGNRATFEGGKFEYRYHMKRWHFVGWMEGKDPKKVVVDVIQ